MSNLFRQQNIDQYRDRLHVEFQLVQPRSIPLLCAAPDRHKDTLNRHLALVQGQREHIESGYRARNHVQDLAAFGSGRGRKGARRWQDFDETTTAGRRTHGH